MFVPSVQQVNSRRSVLGHRPGAAVPWLILLLPVFVGGFTLAVHVASIQQHQVELQEAVEAAALAGVNALSPLDDMQLFGADPIPAATRDRLFNGPLATYRGAVRDVAVDYAGKNLVGGRNVNLDPNIPASPATQNANGELVIGTLDNPAATTLDTDQSQAWSLYTPRYNTVRVALVRTVSGVLRSQDVSASSQAFLDHDVIGFKVQGSSHTDSLAASVQGLGSDPAIPMVPLAIRTDFATNPPTDTGSWDYQIIFRHGSDHCSIASGTPVCGSGGDGIPEITVRISDLSTDNGQIAALGGTTVADAAGQVATGITDAQLTAYDPTTKQFLLYNPTTSDNQQTLPRLVAGTSDLNNLAAALTAIQDRRRVWPLYDQVTDAPNPTVRVVGFVAARVMSVTNNGTSVDVVLQPTMLLTSTALTEFYTDANGNAVPFGTARAQRVAGSTKRAAGPRQVLGANSIFNPYIGRTQLLR